MSDEKNGGPAFPYTETLLAKDKKDGLYYECGIKEHKGMSLRDYLAGKAISHMSPMVTVEDIAEGAYKIADALLEERKK